MMEEPSILGPGTVPDGSQRPAAAFALDGRLDVNVRMNSSHTSLLQRLSLALGLSMLAACSREAEPPAGAANQAQPAPTEITREQLANLSYPSELGRDGRVQLRNGVYEQEDAAGATAKLVVKLTEHMARGDLNSDGQQDVVVILESDSGGTGTFMDVAAVLNSQKGPNAVATIDLGDRTEIRSVSIDGGSVFVELIGHGPEDPVCCPTQLQRREYHFDGSRLLASTNAPPP